MISHLFYYPLAPLAILWLFVMLYFTWRRRSATTLILPHASVRLPLPQPELTNGGSTKQWRPCTPAVAAGLIDHVWTVREVLLFRVPPWPQPAGV